MDPITGMILASAGSTLVSGLISNLFGGSEEVKMPVQREPGPDELWMIRTQTQMLLEQLDYIRGLSGSQQETALMQLSAARDQMEMEQYLLPKEQAAAGTKLDLEIIQSKTAIGIQPSQAELQRLQIAAQTGLVSEQQITDLAQLQASAQEARLAEQTAAAQLDVGLPAATAELQAQQIGGAGELLPYQTAEQIAQSKLGTEEALGARSLVPTQVREQLLQLGLSQAQIDQAMQLMPGATQTGLAQQALTQQQIGAAGQLVDPTVQLQLQQIQSAGEMLPLFQGLQEAQARTETGLVGERGTLESQQLASAGRLLPFEELLRATQAGTETALIPQRGRLESGQLSNLMGQLPQQQATDLAGLFQQQRGAEFKTGILGGGALPGQFADGLGTPFAQSQAIQDAFGQTSQLLQQRNLIGGGLEKELLAREAGRIGERTEARRRQEQFQLLGLGLS